MSTGHPTPRTFDRKPLDSLRALEAGLVEELVGEFLRAAPRQLGDLRRAASGSDATAVEEIAHRLRGACGMLGAAGMADLAARIEDYGHMRDLRRAYEAVRWLEAEFAAVREALEFELAS